MPRTYNTMSCQICRDPLAQSASFHCPTCARALLYPLRFSQVTTLLERESFGKHVETVVTGNIGSVPESGNISLSGALVNLEESAKHVEWQRAESESASLKERLTLIDEQVKSLNKQIETGRTEVEARKQAVQRRRADLREAELGADARREKELERVKAEVVKMGVLGDRLHTKTVYARRQLCAEAAALVGLRQSLRKGRDGKKRYGYYVGNLRIYDLQELHGANHDQATAMLGSVAQLLVRVSYYLGVRLPAEITLPHRDYPLPTIFSPTSSYQSREVPFPGSTPSHSSGISPDASRVLEHQRPLPRPRPLFFDRQLSDLMKEDPPAYSWFVEGVSLLAYDIAWLCRTQGMHEEFVTFEEICSMGRNLYRLLIDPTAEKPPGMQRVPSSRAMNVGSGSERRPSTTHPPPSPASHARATPSSPSPSPGQPPPPNPRGFGQLSHATAHSFLGAAVHADGLRNWEFQNPARIVDKLKATLLLQMQNAEWEVLEEREWDDMAEAEAEADGGVVEEEEPVVVGGVKGRLLQQDSVKGRRGEGNGSLGGLGAKRTSFTVTGGNALASGVVVDGQSQGVAAAAAAAAARKGVNGWTRLKSRSGSGASGAGVEAGKGGGTRGNE